MLNPFKIWLFSKEISTNLNFVIHAFSKMNIKLRSHNSHKICECSRFTYEYWGGEMLMVCVVCKHPNGTHSLCTFCTLSGWGCEHHTLDVMKMYHQMDVDIELTFRLIIYMWQERHRYSWSTIEQQIFFLAKGRRWMR